MDSRLLTGAVELLILDILSRGDSYGYQVSQHVINGSRGALELKEGSLYPALHRLERRKLLSSYWVDTEDGRRRKYYRITARGKKTLREKRDSWQRFSAGVDGILGQSRARSKALPNVLA